MSLETPGAHSGAWFTATLLSSNVNDTALISAEKTKEQVRAAPLGSPSFVTVHKG